MVVRIKNGFLDLRPPPPLFKPIASDVLIFCGKIASCSGAFRQQQLNHHRIHNAKKAGVHARRNNSLFSKPCNSQRTATVEGGLHPSMIFQKHSSMAERLQRWRNTWQRLFLRCCYEGEARRHVQLEIQGLKSLPTFLLLYKPAHYVCLRLKKRHISLSCSSLLQPASAMVNAQLNQLSCVSISYMATAFVGEVNFQ